WPARHARARGGAGREFDVRRRARDSCGSQGASGVKADLRTQMAPVRILLVEAQTLMRQGLRTILDLEPGLTVVGEAATGEEGVRQALALRPDVILMDVQMPGLNGVAATAEICRVWPAARIIILTTFNRDD